MATQQTNIKVNSVYWLMMMPNAYAGGGLAPGT